MGEILKPVMKEQAGMKKSAKEEIRLLLGNLRDTDWWVRKETIGRLLDYPENMYLSDLEEWLRNGEDALLRNASMEVFKELGDRALGSLGRLLKDEDVDARIFAANVLGDIKEPTALGGLADALQDPDDNVRIAPEIVKAMKKPGKNNGVLAKVLSMIGEKEALMLFANDEDDEVRTEVALAIGSLRTPGVPEALQRLSRDPVEEVRAAALLSLRNSEREVQNQ